MFFLSKSPWQQVAQPQQLATQLTRRQSWTIHWACNSQTWFFPCNASTGRSQVANITCHQQQQVSGPATPILTEITAQFHLKNWWQNDTRIIPSSRQSVETTQHQQPSGTIPEQIANENEIEKGRWHVSVNADKCWTIKSLTLIAWHCWATTGCIPCYIIIYTFCRLRITAWITAVLRSPASSWVDRRPTIGRWSM